MLCGSTCNKTATIRQLACSLAKAGLPTLCDMFLSIQKAPALVTHLRARDSAGFYGCKLASPAAAGIVRFESLTIVHSSWKQSAQQASASRLHHGRLSIVGGTLVAAVTVTADNNIAPLGLLFTAMESYDRRGAPALCHL